jgi:hypothetical protein
MTAMDCRPGRRCRSGRHHLVVQANSVAQWTATSNGVFRQDPVPDAAPDRSASKNFIEGLFNPGRMAQKCRGGRVIGCRSSMQRGRR